jgi:DNA-binding CsgD family transcriptional regulator
MRDLDLHFAEALSQIRNASSPGKLWAQLKAFAAHLGYSHLAGADGARLAGGAAKAIFYTDAPRIPSEIDSAYSYASAPFVERALRSPTPFLMSELRDDLTMSGPWSQLLADVVKRGDGLIVPVYDGDEPVAGFIFGGEKPDTSTYGCALLQVVAHLAFARYRALQTDATRPLHALSVREIQCLRSIAAGKSDSATAVVLGISPRTVRFHVDHAKEKLGCTSRIQAVTKAIREGIIAV